MSKFKVGDKVTRNNHDLSPTWVEFASEHNSDSYTVTGVLGDWIQLDNYTCEGDTYQFHAQHFTLAGEVETTLISDSWDYAEADRLEQAAKDAIKAYNEYVQRQPKKVYLPMYLPD